MVLGVTAEQRRRGGARGLFLALLGLWLASCGSGNDDGAGGSLSGGWRFETGGQTGSLTPVCGLAAAARGTDLPESVAGVVVDTRRCAPGESAFALFDAEGRAVPFAAQPLGDGTWLLVPASGLAPGSYVLGRPQGDAGPPDAAAPDRDAGADADAGEAQPSAHDSSVAPEGDAVRVVAAAAPALRLGALAQSGAACVATFELTLDPSVVPYVPLLAIDVSIDGGAPRRLVEFGALDAADGSVTLGLPPDVVDALYDDAEITISATLAGSDAPIEPARLDVSCRPPPNQVANSADEAGGCSTAVRATSTGLSLGSWLLAALALRSLRRRRRRRRPPD